MANRFTTAESKFVGVYLPRQICSYLSLYALGTGVSKSKIMRDCIEKWYQGNQRTSSIESLISKLADEAQKEWDARKAIHRYEWGNKIDTAFDFYKREFMTKLERKGIDQEHIKQILGQLNNEED